VQRHKFISGEYPPTALNETLGSTFPITPLKIITISLSSSNSRQTPSFLAEIPSDEQRTVSCKAFLVLAAERPETRTRAINRETSTEPLSGEHHSAASLLDLLLSKLGEELRLHDERLRREVALPEHLEKPMLRDVQQRRRRIAADFLPHCLGHERPELVDVDERAEEFVLGLVEVPHSDLSEVSRMVFVEENSMVVQSSGVSSSSGMLSVFADSPMPSTNMASLFSVLLQPRRHRYCSECCCSC
jgi:hypothetical protein